jgi:hypothetical protein
MKCPYCKKTINEVDVESTAWQRATIDNNNNIVEFDGVELGNTLSIVCVKCRKSIREYIKE